MPEPSVPGYDVDRLLGHGSAGEVWLARERSTFEPVAVRVLMADSPDEVDRLQRESVRLAAVRHAHLVRLRTVLPVDGGVALVSDFLTDGSLADLLGARGVLTAGEVLTVGVPLAAALAVAHAQGRVHGRVSAANVVLTGDGRPLLADLGLAGLVAREAAGSPADDVRALAIMLTSALPGDAPLEQRGCLERVSSAAPADRPSADELGRELRRAGPPAPLRLTGARSPRPVAPGQPGSAPPVALSEHRMLPAAVGRPPSPSPSQPASPPASPASPRRPSPLVLVGTPVALVAAVLAGRAWAAADRPIGPPPLHAPGAAAAVSATPAAVKPTPAAPTAMNWSVVLTQLDSRRAAALANLDPAALADVYAEGSAPLAADAAAIRQLTAAGARPTGLRLEIRSAQLVRQALTSATVRVVDRLPPYDLVGVDGRVIERRPGRGAASWLVELVPAGDGWRIAGVTRA